MQNTSCYWQISFIISISLIERTLKKIFDKGEITKVGSGRVTAYVKTDDKSAERAVRLLFSRIMLLMSGNKMPVSLKLRQNNHIRLHNQTSLKAL